MEIRFCRRCGSPVEKLTESSFECTNGHKLFYDASPGAAAWLTNDAGEALVVVRAKNPGKGLLCSPGGYCDFGENLEEALVRELREELGLEPSDYGSFTYLGSRPDNYEWEGNVTRLLGVVFHARLKGNPTITPGDDAADFVFMKPSEIPRDKLAFPSQNFFVDALIDHLKTAA